MVIQLSNMDMKSLSESLFDKDLVDKDIPTFGDYFEIDDKYSLWEARPLWNQFSETRLKKDIQVKATPGNETIYKGITKIVEQIVLPGNLSISEFEKEVAEYINPYVLSAYKNKQNNVYIWCGTGGSKDTDIMSFKKIYIEIIGLTLVFNRK